MKINLIEDKATWDSFFAQAGSPSFLQSWEWGEFNKQQGYEIYRLGLYKGPRLVAIALTIKVHSRRGTFLFVPHGPVVEAALNHALYEEKPAESKRLMLHDI